MCQTIARLFSSDLARSMIGDLCLHLGNSEQKELNAVAHVDFGMPAAEPARDQPRMGESGSEASCPAPNARRWPAR